MLTLCTHYASACVQRVYPVPRTPSSAHVHATRMQTLCVFSLSLSLSLSLTHTHTHTQRHYINRHNLIGKDLSCLRCPPCKCPAAQSIHTEVLPHTKRFFFFEGEERFGDTYRQKTESMERPGAGFGV